MRRTLRVLAFAATGALAATAACGTPAAPAAKGGEAAAVDAAIVRNGVFTVRVHATGRVGAPAGNDAKLAFASGGIVRGIDVRVGQTVRTGDALAELDTTGLALDARQARLDALAAASAFGNGAGGTTSVASARAKLAAARERLALVRAGVAPTDSDASAAAAAVRQSAEKIATDRRALDRAQRLFEGGVAAAKDVDAARSTLRLDVADLAANRSKERSSVAGVGGAAVQAEADVRQAQNDLDVAAAVGPVARAQALSAQAKAAQADRLLANGVLRSPMDGVVLQILKHAGEAADASAPAIVVGPARAHAVTLVVAGADAALVRTGEAVALRVTGRDVRARGIVRAVVPAVDPATQTGTVVVDGTLPGAAAGDAVDASIDVGDERGTIVPTSAVVQDPETAKTLVFVRTKRRDGSVRFVSRTVVVRAGDERTTLLGSGVRAGDAVAAQGAFDLLAPVGGGG